MSTHPLPDLYAGWAGDLLPGPVPGEPLATCDDCAMCVQDDGTAPASIYFFDPEVKCCVYMPRLPNFLVGRILAGEEGPGRRSVQERLEAGQGVTPLGLDRPPRYDLLYRNSANAIGRSRELRCPHYVEADGTCGIWRHRDAQCATWFCRHERGVIGAEFWGALRDLLTVVEGELARWAALEEGIPAERLAPLLPRTAHDHREEPPPDGPALDGIPDRAAHAARWGARAGDEAGFYRACAERVAGLAWAEVLALCGTEVRVRAAAVQARYDRLRDETLPQRLRVGRFEVVATRPGGVRVVTESTLDAMDLPAALLAVLPAFDGRPRDEVLAELKATWNVAIDPPFLRQLFDHRVLVEARDLPGD